MLDVRYPTLYLANVEVCISGEVLTDWGVDVTQRAVKGGATQTDHYGNQAKQEEKQAGVPTANIYRERETEGRMQGVGVHPLFITMFSKWIYTFAVGYLAWNITLPNLTSEAIH